MGVMDRDVQVMEEKAQLLTSYQSTLQQYIEEIQSTAQGLSGNFEGEAGEAFQTAVSSDIAQMQRLHETIGQFINAFQQDIERTRELYNSILTRHQERN